MDTSNRWSRTTWRAAAEWDLRPQSLAYASVETGFKSGGFYFTHDNPIYNPEKVIAYTLGSKNRFLNNRLQLNAEAFLWQYRDQQISHIVADSTGVVVFATQNVGKATIRGAELDAVSAHRYHVIRRRCAIPGFPIRFVRLHATELRGTGGDLMSGNRQRYGVHRQLQRQDATPVTALDTQPGPAANHPGR